MHIKFPLYNNINSWTGHTLFEIVVYEDENMGRNKKENVDCYVVPMHTATKIG